MTKSVSRRSGSRCVFLRLGPASRSSPLKTWSSAVCSMPLHVYLRKLLRKDVDDSVSVSSFKQAPYDAPSCHRQHLVAANASAQRFLISHARAVVGARLRNRRHQRRGIGRTIIPERRWSVRRRRRLDGHGRGRSPGDRHRGGGHVKKNESNERDGRPRLRGIDQCSGWWSARQRTPVCLRDYRTSYARRNRFIV